MRFQIKMPDSSFNFLFPFVGKLVLHRLHCSAKIMMTDFGCSHSTYWVVMFHFLFCVVFSKLLQSRNSTLLLMPKSMFMLNSYHSLENNKLLKFFHFNFYTFPLITFFCIVAHNFNVFFSFSKYVSESPD